MGNAHAKELEAERIKEEEERKERIKRQTLREEKRKTREIKEIEMFRKRVREVDHFWVLIRLSNSFFSRIVSEATVSGMSSPRNGDKKTHGDETTSSSTTAADGNSVNVGESGQQRNTIGGERKKARSIVPFLPSSQSSYQRKKIPMVVAVKANPQETVHELKKTILNSLPSEFKESCKELSPSQTWLTLPYHGKAGTKREFLGKGPRSGNSDNDDDNDEGHGDGDEDVILSDTHLLDVSISWRVLTLWRDSPPSPNIEPQVVHIESTNTDTISSISVCFDEPVATLKAAIRDEEGTPVRQQFLQIADTGAKLDNDYLSLAEAGVKPGCKLILTRIRHVGDLAIAVAKRKELLRSLNNGSTLNPEEIKIEEDAERMLDLSHIATYPLSKDWADIVTRLSILNSIAQRPATSRRMTTLNTVSEVPYKGGIILDAQSDISGLTPLGMSKKMESPIATTVAKKGIMGTISTLQKKTVTNVKGLRQRASIFGGFSSKPSRGRSGSNDPRPQMSSLVGKLGLGDSDGFICAFAPGTITPGQEFYLDFILYAPKMKPRNPDYATPFSSERDQSIEIGLGPIVIDGAVRLRLEMPRENYQILDSDTTHDIGWSGFGFRGTKFKILCLPKNSAGLTYCKARLFINGEARSVLCFAINIEQLRPGHPRNWIPTEIVSSLTLIPPRTLDQSMLDPKNRPSKDIFKQAEKEDEDIMSLSRIFGGSSEPMGNLDEDEYDVYISYRRCQKEFATKMKAVLEAVYGYRVFIGPKPKSASVKGLDLSTSANQESRLVSTDEEKIENSNAPVSDAASKVASQPKPTKRGVKPFQPDPDEVELTEEYERVLRKAPIVIVLVTPSPSGSTKQRSTLSSFASIKSSLAAEQQDRIYEELKIATQRKNIDDVKQSELNTIQQKSQATESISENEESESSNHNANNNNFLGSLALGKKPLEKIVLLVSRKGDIDIQKELSHLPQEMSEALQEGGYVELDTTTPPATTPTNLPKGMDSLAGVNFTSYSPIHAQIQAHAAFAISGRSTSHKTIATEIWHDRLILERRNRLKERARNRLEVWDLDTRVSSDIVCRVYEEAGAEEALALVRAGAEARHDASVAESLEQIAEENAEDDKEAAVTLYKSSRRIKLLLNGSTHPSLASSLERMALIEADAEQKMELLETNAEMKEERLGPEGPNPEIALAWDVAAGAVKEINQAHASVLRRKALDSWRQVLGQMHPLVMCYARRLGEELIEARRYKEAKALLEDTITGQRARLGGSHPSTTTTFKLLQEVSKFEGTEEKPSEKVESN